MHFTNIIGGAVTLSAVALSAPTPMPFPQTDSHPICSADENDPASWVSTGARDFLEQQLTEHGQDNWLTELDRRTTGPGGQPTALDCKALGGTTCMAPSVACVHYTPPELWYIRRAAAHAQNFFTAAQRLLTEKTLAGSLQVGKMTTDFAPPDGRANQAGTFRQVGAGFSIADKVIKQTSGPIGDAFGLLGAIFSLISANLAVDAGTPVDVDRLADEVHSELGNFFERASEQIVKFNSKLFGGDDDIDINAIVDFLYSAHGVEAPSDVQQPISKVFASGDFLVEQSQSKFEEGLNQGLQAVKQQILAQVLRGQNWYVWVNTNRDENACNGITGARFIDGECYMIEARYHLKYITDPDSQVMPAEMVKKLDDPNEGYNINMEAFYRNIRDCNNDNQNPTGLDLGSEYPKCFFNLPFIRTRDYVCNVEIYADLLAKMPEGLQFENAPDGGTCHPLENGA